MKDVCINKFLIALVTFSLSSSVCFTKMSVRSTVLIENDRKAMIENWKRYIDKGKTFGALLTGLSKAFDCLLHNHIISKIKAYGFTQLSLL